LRAEINEPLQGHLDENERVKEEKHENGNQQMKYFGKLSSRN
jgi:hypothetical protein